MAYGEYTILQHKVMTELVRKFPTPQFIGKSLFPEKPILSDTAEWDEIHQNRDMADYNVPDGEGKVVKRIGITNKTSQVAHIREKKQLKGSTMAWLRKPGTEHMQYGEQAVKEELKDLDSRVEFRREWARWQALTGTLTVDQADVKFTVDYGIAASHKPTVGTSWTDVSADIIGDLKTYKRLIQEDSGENASVVYCTDEVMTMMMKNTGVKALMGEQLKTQILQNGYIVKLMGLTFVVYDAGYVPEGGSFTKFINEKYIVMVTSSNFAEEQIAPCADVESGLKPGKFSKSWMDKDPAGIWVLVDINCLPIIKKVENIVYAKVDTT